MVVAERTHAHDSYVAVGFDRQIRLHGQIDLDAGGILRIDAHLGYTPNLGPSRVTHGGADLESASEGKKGVKGFCGVSEGPGNAEDRGHQNDRGNDDKQSHQRLFTSWFHLCTPLSGRAASA